MQRLASPASLLALAVGLLASAAAEQPAQPKRNDSGKTRAEERNALVANLRAHCRKMLEAQMEVLRDTRDLHKEITGRADKQPRTRDLLISAALADRVKEMVTEAGKGIELVGTEELAVLTDAFRELGKDLKKVQASLEKGDTGAATQAVEQDIIDLLEEMIDVIAIRRR
jgi:hypothetical protein